MLPRTHGPSQTCSAQFPSESLPASYGPGAGILVRAMLAPLCAPRGLRSGFHRRRFAQCPSESLPVSYGPGAGTLVRPSPVLFLCLPRGGWYGVSMCPASSHTRTVGSFVGSPRRLLNDRNLSPLHPLPPLGLILFYWRWGLFAECHLMTGPLLPRHIFA